MTPVRPRRAAGGVLALAAVVVLAAGCTPTAAPVRTAAPSPSVRAPAGTAVALVVTAGSELVVDRLDSATGVAVPERRLEPPVSYATVVDVSMTAGPDPVVCASWHTGFDLTWDDLQTSLLCYPPGSSRGTAVAGTGHPDQVALSADGRRLAWSEIGREGRSNPVLDTARLVGTRVVAVRRFPGTAGTAGDRFSTTGVADLAWGDTGHLVVSASGPSAADPRLLVVDVGGPGRAGWLRAARATPDPSEPPGRPAGGSAVHTAVTSAATGTALAVERVSGPDGEQSGSLAVRVDTVTGRVREVIGSPAPGRRVAAVSAAATGVLWSTTAADAADPDLRADLHRSGQPGDLRITGLPADATAVLSQDH